MPGTSFILRLTHQNYWSAHNSLLLPAPTILKEGWLLVEEEPQAPHSRGRRNRRSPKRPPTTPPFNAGATPKQRDLSPLFACFCSKALYRSPPRAAVSHRHQDDSTCCPIVRPPVAVLHDAPVAEAGPGLFRILPTRTQYFPPNPGRVAKVGLGLSYSALPIGVGAQANPDNPLAAYDPRSGQEYCALLTLFFFQCRREATNAPVVQWGASGVRHRRLIKYAHRRTAQHIVCLGRRVSRIAATPSAMATRLPTENKVE